MDSTRSERLKAAYREEYQAKNKEVKKQLRRDRRNWIDQIARDAEKAAKTGNMKMCLMLQDNFATSQTEEQSQ